MTNLDTASVKFGRAARRRIWAVVLMLAVDILATGVAAAHADPANQAEPEVVRYTATAAPSVCRSLDARPTLRGVLLAMQDVTERSGFDSRQASQVVTLSVLNECPRHTHLLNEIVALVSPKAGQPM